MAKKWRYLIRIENLKPTESVTLRQRNWNIFSEAGTFETVRGNGVVGRVKINANITRLSYNIWFSFILYTNINRNQSLMQLIRYFNTAVMLTSRHRLAKCGALIAWSELTAASIIIFFYLFLSFWGFIFLSLTQMDVWVVNLNYKVKNVYK